MDDSAIVFMLGPLGITRTVVTTWGLMMAMTLFFALCTRNLQKQDSLLRTALESIVAAMDNAVREVINEHSEAVFPFIASMWMFLVVANLLGIVPELHSPTGDLSTTAALAFVVFVSVHWFGIRYQGLRNYLKHYLSPSPILLPFHILSEITRSLALTIRLFGNIMSLEMAALLVLLVAGFLVPVPLLALHIIEALVQAYIFGVLALLYIASALESHTSSPSTSEPTQPKKPSSNEASP